MRLAAPLFALLSLFAAHAQAQQSEREGEQESAAEERSSEPATDEGDDDSSENEPSEESGPSPVGLPSPTPFAWENWALAGSFVVAGLATMAWPLLNHAMDGRCFDGSYFDPPLDQPGVGCPPGTHVLFGDVSAALLSVGAAMIGAGFMLILFQPIRSARATSARLAIGVGGSGLVLHGQL